MVPADLESGSESEDDNDNDNDDDFIPNESDDDDDYDSESSDEDDGSNKHYLYSQVKRMQKQITAILGYLSKGAVSIEEASIESNGGI